MICLKAAPVHMIRIITIEREYGSGAARIAATLAAQLGWTLWDQLLTEEVARLAHSNQAEVRKHEERRDPLYYRLLKSFTLGSYEGSPGAPVEDRSTSCESVMTLCASFSTLPEKTKYGDSSPKETRKRAQ